MKKRLLLLITGVLLSCAACGNTNTSQESQVTEVAETTEEVDAEEYGEVVIQNGDRTLVFTSMPTAVLCCNLYSAENMVMLGLEDYIVAKNVPANDAETPLPELADSFDGMLEIERSHENAVASGADLVIGQVSAFKDSAWGSYEMFEEKDINCYTISGTLAEDETIEHVYEDIRFLGKAFKVEEKAEALIADMEARVSAVREAVAEIAEEDRLSVFVMDSFNGNEIYTTSAGLQSNLIELAGATNSTRNMADSRWFTTSIETVVASNPDYIIFNDYGTQTIEEKIAFIDENPALAEVTAVKNKAYITIPLVAVMQDVRAASACELFAQTFYPECFE